MTSSSPPNAVEGESATPPQANYRLWCSSWSLPRDHRGLWGYILLFKVFASLKLVPFAALWVPRISVWIACRVIRTKFSICRNLFDCLYTFIILDQNFGQPFWNFARKMPSSPKVRIYTTHSSGNVDISIGISQLLNTPSETTDAVQLTLEHRMNFTC